MLVCFLVGFVIELFYWQSVFATGDSGRMIIADYRLRTIYKPLFVAVSLFISVLAAINTRPLTIVVAGGISLLALWIAPTYTNPNHLTLTVGYPTGNDVAGQSIQKQQPSDSSSTPSPKAAQSPPPQQLAMEQTTTTTPQQRAIKRFPDLAIVNSKLNQEFVRRYRQYQKEKPTFFNDPEWPTALARESQNAILTH